MISTFNKQQTVSFTGDIGEYTISGQYLMMDDYITAIDVEVYTNVDQCLGFIHFDKQDSGNDEMHVSYNCDYAELPTLQKFFPVLLEEFKLYMPDAFILNLDASVSLDETTTDVPDESPVEEPVETPEISEDNSTAEQAES